MKKVILALLTIIGSISSGYSATCLRLVLADGDTPSYTLTQKPKVTFSGDNMLVTTEETEVTYNRADIAKMEFTEDSSAGIEVTEEENFSYMEDMITCRGGIVVYGLDGSVRAEGNDNLSISHLSSGIYIAKTKHHTVKIIKK